jgi:acyl-CoA thioester hydrolase
MMSSEPLEILVTRVKPEWLDYNGHMNAGYYAVAYNEAIEFFLEKIGLGEDIVRKGIGMTFAMECHLTYQHELMENDPIRITAQLLDYNRRLFHFFLRMDHAERGFLASTYEQISLFVDFKTRRAASMPAFAFEKLKRLHKEHRTLPKPPEVGGTIAIRRNGINRRDSP